MPTNHVGHARCSAIARLLVCILGIAILPVTASDFYWDGDGTAAGNDSTGTGLGGSGNWNTSSLIWWDLTSDVPWPNTGTDAAIFTGSYAAGVTTYSTVALDPGIVANQLRFLRSGYTLTGGDLTLDGSTPTLFAGMGLFATIESQILGSAGLTMAGGGWIRLGNNSNGYTGVTTLANGALVITNQSALGSDASAIVVTGIPTYPGSTQLHSVGGGTLVLDGTGGNITISRDLSLQGQGATSRQGAALISTGVNTLSGTINMGVDSGGTYQNTRIVAADGTLNLTNTLNVLGTAGTTISSLGGVQQAGASFYNVTGTLTGTGTLEGSGGGTLFLNPTDSSGFSGVVRVSGSAASGQSVVRIDSPNVLGTRTAGTTSAVLDLNGGVLAVLMDSPSVQAGGSNANVYGRDTSTFFADHTPSSSVKDQTVAFGTFTFEDNETFTFNSRNGYGMSFGSTTVNGGNNNTIFANNLQGGALLTFAGNFWNNTDKSGNYTLTISGEGNALITGNVLANNTDSGENHSLTKGTGAGTLTITSTGATLDGDVTVQNGTLAITDWRSINNNNSTINLGYNSGTTNRTGALSIIGNNLSLANLTTSKVINLAGTTGGGILLANQTGTSPGVVLNADFTATGAGSKTLTLGGTNTAANTINGAIVDNSATNKTSVTKIDTGTWVLAGTNTYTGATTISNGILKVLANGGSSTVLADTSAITFNTINVYAGGTLEFVGQTSNSNVEYLGALTPTNGSGTIKLTPGSGGTASLVFASLGSVGGGGTVNFVTPSSGDTIAFTTISTANNIANAGLYFNGSDFAFIPGAGLTVRAPIYGSDSDFVTSATALTAARSNEITGSFATPGALAIDSLKINGNQTLTLGGNLTIRTAASSSASGGIIQTGGSGTITGDFVVGTNGSGATVINVDGGANTLTLESKLSGSGGLTKVGLGTLRLGGANAQTGTVSVNEGTVRLMAGGTLGGAGALTIRQDGILELNGITPTNVTNAFNNNGIVRNTSATTDVTFTVGGGNGTGTSYGIIEDGGLAKVNVVKIGTGGQSWLGLSTYTGTTTIGSTGMVTINNLQDGGMASGIGASSEAASNLIFNGFSSAAAGAAPNYGGISFTGTTNDSTDRLFTFDGDGVSGPAGARIQANGVNNATSVWRNTGALAFGTNATGVAQGLTLGGASTGDNRFFPVIQDNGLAQTSLNKADAGVWYLEAANGYTGATTLYGGTLYANDGTSLPTDSNLVLSGGNLATTGTFSRAIGAGSGQMQWASYASGGFSAGGSSLTVDFGNGNVWGSTAGFLGAGALLLNNSGVAKADVDVISSFEITKGSLSSFSATTTAGSSTVTLTSGTTAGLTAGQLISGNANIPNGYYITAITGATTFTLNSGTGVLAATGVATDASGDGYRQINVGDFTSIGADFATISGVISGAGNLAKEGAGILNLRGANTYTGQTLVRQGTLVVETLGSSGSAGATSPGEQLTANTDASAIALGNGGTTAGILEYVGLGETSDRKIRLNTTTGSTQIHADGVGPLILTNVANDMVAGNKLLYLRGANAAGNMVTSRLSDNGGTLGVTVDGGATWILTNPLNDYSGTTTAGGGALGIGDNSALGSSNLSMTGGNVFAYGADRTLGNAISQGNNSTIGFLGDYSLTFSSALALGTGANNATLVNSIVAGKAVSFAGVTANSLTANRSWTIDGSGTTIVDGDITTNTAFGLGITKTGDGTLVLNGNTAPNFNQNSATIDIDRGFLKLGASGVIPDGAGYGSVTMSPELVNADTATLDLNGQSETINGLTANTDGAAVIDNTAATPAFLTFGANNSAVSFGGGTGTYTITDSGAGALSIKKTGTAAVTIPTGVTLTYQGATAVDTGSFTIASPVNGTTALSVVNSGSTLAFTGGITNPSAITSVVIEDGGTLSLLDGAGNKIDSLTNLQLGSGGGSMTTLNLNVGDHLTAGDKLLTDTLTLQAGGTLGLFSGNQITLNLTDIGLSGNQTYDLLALGSGWAGTGFTTGALSASNWILGATPGGFDSMTLIKNDDIIQLQTGNLITGTLYWRGLTDNTWNADLNNWSTDKGGNTPGSTIPGAGTNVIFAYNGATGAITTTLEQNFRVNSMTFEAGTSTPSSVTINPGSDPTNRVGVAPDGNPGIGISIESGGPASVTISGPVRLGANQTWNVADSGSVLSLGSLLGEADVTVSGSGKIILTAASDPTFNSGVTSDFTISSATLEIQNAAALGNTINSNLATVSVGSGGAFYYKGAANTAATGVANNLTLSGATLSAGGSTGNYYYTGSVNVSADSFINLRDSNGPAPGTTQSNVVLSGPVSGAGKLTVDSINTSTGGNQYTGTFYLQNDNSSWSGGMYILRGSVQTQTVTGLGTGDISAEAGRIQFVTAGGTTHNLNQNITVDAPGGGILELSADASGTPASDMTVNLNGMITIGSALTANNALRFTQASDNFSVFNLGGSIVLGNNASISYQGSSVRSLNIPVVISDGGSGYSLAINDELGGWGVTSRTVQLTGLNTFSGNISISEGTLEFDTVTNAGGAASSLGQGSTIALGGASLSFIGNSNQSTNRPITNSAGSPTLSANGTGGATITYTGAITQAVVDQSITLSGTGAGIISGGITQPAGAASADLVVNSGEWTLDTNDVTIADDFLLNGGTVTLQNLAFKLNDDIIVTGSSSVLNLNSTGVWTPSNPGGTSSFAYARGGGVINLNAHDVNGIANANGTEGLLLGDGTAAGTGTLNTNGYNITIPRLDLGSTNPLYAGVVTGNGIITATYIGTDYAQGFRLFEGSIDAKLAGGSPILKQGLGDVTLSGDNSGLSGSVAAATRLDSGNLILDYATSNTTKLPTNQALDMRGGRLSINGSNGGPTSQSLASFTLGNGGSNRVAVNPGSGQTAVLSLGAITRANGSQDGTIRFLLPAGAQSDTNGVTTTSPNSTFGLLGTGSSSSSDAAYATVNDGTGVWFATGVSNGTNNNVVALISTVKNDITSWTSGDHVTDSTGFTGGALTCTSINSLRLDAATGSDLVAAAGSTFNIASGGILVTSNVGGTPSITGGTLVSGTQELVIHQDSSQPFEIGSAIRGAYAVTKTGAGTLLLSGNNSYTDETEIQEGILRVGGGNAIGDTSLVTLADDHASTLELLASETIGRLQGGSATTGLDQLAVVDIGTHALTINQTGNTTYAGLLTGTGNVLKLNTGNLQLTNVSSGFTGVVTVDYGLFYLTGLGQMNASMIRVNKGGSFMIDNNGTTRSATRILDTTPITLDSADGTFASSTIVRGLAIRTDQNATTNETVGNLNFNSGANYLSGEADVGSGTAVTFLIANNFVRYNNATFDARGRALGANSGERNQFKIGDSANEITFLSTLVGDIANAGTKLQILPWAIGALNSGTNGALTDNDMGNSLMTYVSGRGLRPLDLATEYNAFTPATTTENVRESLASSLIGLSGKTVNSLVIDNAAFAGLAVTGSGAGQVLAVTSGALLFTVSGGAASTPYDTTLGGFDDGITVDPTGEYIVYVVNPSSAATTSTLTATISSPLMSAADITKSGRGTLILTGINTAGGGSNKTTLNEGILEISSLDNIGGTTGALVFAGGTLRLGAGLTDDISQRAIAFLQGGATIDTNGLTYSLANAVGSGIGGLTKAGSGTLTLNAAATYTGPTIVSAGTLTVGANNATGNGGNLTILGGATLDVGINSITHDLVTLSGADPVIAGTGSLAAATGFFFDHDGGSDLVTVDAVLAGPGGLLKANRASNLTLNGLNTFTGPVEVQQGTLAFNSIANVGDPSALGAPTNLEDGIIHMGLTSTATTLTYTGSGHSTDRIIALQGTTGGLTINSSGTGALALGTIKGANAGTKTLTLDGSVTGFENSVALIEECIATLNLTKTGASTWLLGGVNSYSGTTYVNEGTLKIGVNDSLPTSTAVRVGTGSTAGTLDLSGFDQTIGSLTVQSTTNTVTNNVVVNSGKTLTINGAVTLGVNANASSTAVTASGGGAIIVNSGGANFQVGGATGSTNDNQVTADFSGLDSFTANLGTGTFRLGDGNSGTEDNSSTFKLATNNTITAASFRIGDGSGGSYTHTLTLGSGTNLINADTINVGSAGSAIRSGGAIVFDPGDTTGTITFRASDGNNRTTLNMVNTTGSTSGSMISMIDFTGHSADILVGTLTMASRTANSGGASATLNFDQGSLDVTTLNMASRTSTGTGSADATLNIGGGTAAIGAVNMAVNTSSGGTVTADLNVTGGGVTIGTGSGTAINMANAGSGRTVTSTIELDGGMVSVTGHIARSGGAGTENATVILNGSTLEMNGNSIGSGAQSITLAAQSGALQNLGELNDGGDLIKMTGGILTLAGTNTYTGNTKINEGTLLVDGATSASSDFTIGIGTPDLSVVLGGTGTIGGGVTAAGGSLTAGKANEVLAGVGSNALTIGGNLKATSASTWLVDLTRVIGGDSTGTYADLITLNGNIDLTNFTLVIDDTNPGLDSFGDRYRFASFSPGTGGWDATSFFTGLGQGGSIFGSVNGSPFTVDYDDAGGAFYLISAIPEPGTLMPALLFLVLGFLFRRRRNCG